MAVMLPGLLTPFLVSLVFLFASRNKSLTKDFFNRRVNLKLIRPAMLPNILVLMAATVILSVAISVLFGGSPEQFQFADGFSFSTLAVPVLAILLLAATIEELG